MVAGCPKCSARYRVDVDRIGPDGAKLRCTKCSAVFLVRAPKPAAVAPPPAPAAPESVVDTPPAAAASSAAAPTRDQARAADQGVEANADVDPARLVIIADPDEARGKQSADAIAEWGLVPHLVHDGVEAMLAIQRMLPAAVVLDAALPKMFGFQVCEVIKRNESLKHTIVVLVGAIHHEDRYRRAPADLYGANVYIEQPDLPDGLAPILEESGMIRRPAPPAAPEPASAPPSRNEAAANAPSVSEVAAPAAAKPAPSPVAPPASQTPAAAQTPSTAPTPATPPAPAMDEDPERAEERERAERLARIAVSEMLLYSPEKFEQAVADGNLEQVLDLEIQEARALLRQRISEEVRAEKDFVIVELNRVAAERGGQG